MSSGKTIKVMLFEDNESLRDTLSLLIQTTVGLDLTGAYPDCREALIQYEVWQPDVVLMDIDMPYITGIEATSLIKDKFPDANILMLTIYEDKEKLFASLCAGASGYLLKKSTSQEITNAILELHNGGAPMTPSIARKALLFFEEIKKQNIAPTANYDLSEREKDILKRLVEGDSYKLIAAHLFISQGTVRVHIMNVYRKLHVNSKSEAVAKAIKEKIV